MRPLHIQTSFHIPIGISLYFSYKKDKTRRNLPDPFSISRLLRAGPTPQKHKSNNSTCCYLDDPDTFGVKVTFLNTISTSLPLVGGLPRNSQRLRWSGMGLCGMAST